MSTLVKWLVMLVLWLLFSLLAFQTCVKECCEGCCAPIETTTPPPPVETEVQRYPIDFNWNNAQAFTNEGYEAMRTRLVNEMGPDNTLVVTGRYYASEVSPDPAKYATMGLARAAMVRDLLAKYIPAERIVLSDLKLDDNANAQSGYFEAVDFEWRAKDAKETSEVVQLDNKVVIRFPYSSAVNDPDPTVDEYLDKLALRLSQTTERVRLTGHTDDRGPDDANMRLSERRTKFIRDLLVRKGVDKARIDMAWKGETMPTSTNDTEEGRHNNRRVEVEILPR